MQKEEEVEDPLCKRRRSLLCRERKRSPSLEEVEKESLLLKKEDMPLPKENGGKASSEGERAPS